MTHPLDNWLARMMYQNMVDHPQVQHNCAPVDDLSVLERMAVSDNAVTARDADGRMIRAYGLPVDHDLKALSLYRHSEEFCILAACGA